MKYICNDGFIILTVIAVYPVVCCYKFKGNFRKHSSMLSCVKSLLFFFSIKLLNYYILY